MSAPGPRAIRSPDDLLAARAFKALFDEHAQRLTGFAYGYVRSIDGARDIVQDVFTRLWEQRTTLPDSDLVPYLFRAARNRALDVLKHQNIIAEWEVYVAQQHEGREPAEEHAGDQAIAEAELAAQIRHAMQRLTPRVQEIVRLHREEELSPGEIAHILGLAPATVYSQLSRALKQLAETLRE